MIEDRYCSTLNGLETVRLGVGVVLIDESSRLLLELRSDVHSWGITGGKLDVGETPQQCGCREIYEETGVSLSPSDLVLFNVYGDPSDGRILQYPDNRVHLVDIIFTASVNSLHPLTLSCESISLSFFSVCAIPDNLVPPSVRPIADLIKSGLIQ